MMNERVKRISEQAKVLSSEELEELVEELLVNLHQKAPAEADQAWRELIDARLAELDAGGIEMFDFEQTVAGLRNK